MRFEAFLISFPFWFRVTKPQRSGACRGRSGRWAGGMRRNPAPPALANQSPPASPQGSPTEGSRTPSAISATGAPMISDCAQSQRRAFSATSGNPEERLPSVFGRPPHGRDARATGGRPRSGPSQTCGCSRGPSARREDAEPPRCPLGASGQRRRDGRCRRGAG